MLRVILFGLRFDIFWWVFRYGGFLVGFYGSVRERLASFGVCLTSTLVAGCGQ